MVSKSTHKIHTTSCGTRYVSCVFYSSREELNKWLQEVYAAEGHYIDEEKQMAWAWWLQ